MNKVAPPGTDYYNLSGEIATDQTEYPFTIDAAPNDTLWFSLRAYNADVDPMLYSEFQWVPWVFFSAPKPPVPPEGLSITTTFELINP